MKTIEDKIRRFVENDGEVTKTTAFLKVGRESGDDAETIIAKMMADILFRFHGIPYRSGQQ